MKIGINPSSQGYNVNGDWNEALGTNDIAHMVVEKAKEYNMDVKIYWGGNCKKGSSNIAGIKRSLTKAMKDGVDLFLSFHTDSAGDQNNDGRGYTGSLLLYRTTADKKFGETIVDHACKVAGIPFYASRKRTNLLVLRKTVGIPSCLIEIANHSDPDDVKLLLDPNWRRRYAAGLVEGLVHYMGGKISKPTPAKSKPVPKPSGPRNLRKGTGGADVTKLQVWLADHGYDIGQRDDGKALVDGYFGAKTDKAVRQFQKDAGLKVDGVVGNNTRAAIANWKSKSKPISSDPRSMKKDCRGEDIKHLQVWLRGHRFDCGKVDGIFGPKTEHAVRLFQAAAGLSIDGIVGPKTRAAMANWVVPKQEMLSLIKQGSRGNLVRKAQTILRTKGYPLAVDGIFGPQTRRAVVRFQSSHGLNPDGRIGRKTWGKLLA